MTKSLIKTISNKQMHTSLFKTFIKNVVLGKFTFLLFSLILMTLIMPSMTEVKDHFVYAIFASLIFVGSVYSILQNKKFLAASIVFVTLSMVANWLLAIWPDHIIFQYCFLIQPLFMFYVFILILDHILRSREVTADIIMGSICGYMILGIIFGMLFMFSAMLYEYAFSIPSSKLTQTDVFYLSFTTISTLGYGDITPKIAITKSLCVLESVMGLFYMSTLVARLVGLQIAKSMKTHDEN
ncbi:MAG: potassium channel family protein [Cyanobacteriota bacterium]